MKQIISVFTFVVLLSQSGIGAEELTPNAETPRPIAKINIEDGGRKCVLYALTRSDQSLVELFRADPPGGKYSIIYFHKNPKYIENYARKVDLSYELSLSADSIKNVNAKFEKKETTLSLLLEVHLNNGEKTELNLPINSRLPASYSYPTSCL